MFLKIHNGRYYGLYLPHVLNCVKVITNNKFIEYLSKLPVEQSTVAPISKNITKLYTTIFAQLNSTYFKNKSRSRYDTNSLHYSYCSVSATIVSS